MANFNGHQWFYNPQQTGAIQGGSPTLQGGGAASTSSLQGSAPKLQATNASAGTLQPTANPMNYVDPEQNSVLGANTAVDPAQAAADAQAAEDARKAGLLRNEITNLVNSIKDIFNSRYGQVDASAGEQTGKLNERFATESGDIVRQVEGENQKIGAAHAAGGTFDSSYRGNNVDTVTRAGEGQIRDLGTELQDNVGKIGGWVSQQKAGFDAQKTGMDQILARLNESTDPAELTQLRNTLDSRITELRAGGADNNLASQNAAALATIAPSSARTVQLKTTLSQILAGNADASQKSVIGARLINSAGLSPEEQQKLLMAFQADLQSSSQEEQQQV